MLWDLQGYARDGRVDTKIMRLLNSCRDFEDGRGPVTYIENHDHSSLTQAVGGRDVWWKMQPALIALFTCPGAVMLHNGQEFGQQELLWEDDSHAPPEFRRVQPRPLRWAETARVSVIDILTCVVAFALERDEDWTLLVPVLLQRFYYRQLMYVVLFRSVKEAVSGRPVGWRGVEPEPPHVPPKTPEVAHA
jgi:hypothetical protein